MRSVIINPVETAIQEIGWVDRYEGVVRSMQKFTASGERKRYMFKCSDTYEDCFRGTGEETSMYFIAPDDSKKSLVFMEINDPISMSGIYDNGPENFSLTVSLKAWVNLKKIGEAECDTADKLISELITKLKSIDRGQADMPIYSVSGIQIFRTDERIFAAYDFHDKWRLFPYDYFTINFTLSGQIRTGCLDPVGDLSEIDC